MTINRLVETGSSLSRFARTPQNSPALSARAKGHGMGRRLPNKQTSFYRTGVTAQYYPEKIVKPSGVVCDLILL